MFFLLILQMKVTGNNLTNICMVVYKVAKTEQNDQLFLEENILSKSCLFFSTRVLLFYDERKSSHSCESNRPFTVVLSCLAVKWK